MLLYYVNLPMQIDYVIMLISMLLPLCFFYGKKSVLLGMGASMVTATGLLYNLLYGIGLIALRGNYETLDGTLIGIILQGMLFTIYCVFACFLKDKRKQIYWAVERIQPIAFIPFVVSMIVFRLDSGYTGEIEQHMVLIIRGSNMTRDGLLGIFTIIICVFAVYLRSQKQILKRQIILNEKCITEQSKQYQFMGEKDEELRKFRHDYNKHVSVLQMLTENKDIEGLEKYIEALGTIKAGLDFVSTNNIICDAIANQYYDLCRKENIGLEVTGKFPTTFQISEVDLCVIISNAMENAYEAAQKCEGHREINFKVKSHGNIIIIEITNPTAECPLIRDGFLETTKSDREYHGYGTKNMCEAAKRSDGTITWEYDGQGILSTRITLLCVKDDKRHQ